MKSKIYLIALILLPVFVIAQSNQNSAVKITFGGYDNNGQAILSIYNLQNCTSSEVVYYQNVALKTVKVQGGQSDTLKFTIVGGNYTVDAASLTACQMDNGSRSTVQLTFPPNILPVKFVSFTGYSEGTKVTLQWITEEDQVNYFEVQESNDGKVWVSKGKIFAGDRNYIFKYSTNAAFFRIASVDKSGEITYSSIIELNHDFKEEMKAFPNPVINTCSISLKTASNEKLYLLNLSGAVVKQINNSGSGLIQVDMNNLPSGMYYIAMGTKQVKIVKQ